MFLWPCCTWALFGDYTQCGHVYVTIILYVDIAWCPRHDRVSSWHIDCPSRRHCDSSELSFSFYIRRRGQWIEIFCHKVFLSSQISIPLNYWRSLSGENAGEPKSWKGLDGGVKFYKLTCSFEIITDLMTPSVKEVVSYNSSRTA